VKKLQNVLLIIIIALSAFLHFYGLSAQEFLGDDAAPMLLIDRMWDSKPLRDPRFLAYPFLFYNEPFRSIFSGTLLHFFGPGRILLRAPSIIFGLLTIYLLVLIFKKWGVFPWLIVLSIAAYSLSPLIINDRSGGGDAQTRFLFLFTGYLLWEGCKHNSIRYLRLTLITWSIGMITMLDTIVLLLVMIAVFWKKRFLINKKTFYLIAGTILFFAIYFSSWLILPYLAYKSGFQNYFDNRGLFYYLSRARGSGSGISFDSIKALIDNTSILFTLWLIGAFLFSFKIKNFLLITLISASSWIAVIFLNHSSSHVVMYAGFFFFQAVLVTYYVIKRFPVTRIPFIIFLICVIVTNSLNLFAAFNMQKIDCLPTSVFRMYKDHNKIPPQRPCESFAEK
jgi:hypothetical protein